eukprot:scaffold4127_cov126-Cylindrotheca_fusiformis.AAC.7
MKLSFALFLASLLRVHSQAGRSQSASLRQGARGGVNFEVNAVRKEKSSYFEEVTPPSNHRSLQTSYWEQVATFDQLANSDQGGYRVSISGDGSLLAAAPRYHSETRNGIVRFFQKQDGAWNENTDLRLFGIAAYDYFGSAVSLSGNGQRVAIGTRNDGGEDNDVASSGSVSIYEMSMGTWGEPLQVIHGENAADRSGSSVALSKDGKMLAIGAPDNDDNGNLSGQVRIYRWDGGTSSFKPIGGAIVGDAGTEYFGYSVALSEDGSVLAVGATGATNVGGESNAGKVRVFYWDDSNWVPRGSRLFGNAETNAFGYSVDLSDDGSILAVGAKYGNYAKVFLWKESNNDNDPWLQIGDTLEGNSNSFGTSVSLSSEVTILAVGSDETVCTYKLVDNEWEEQGELPGSHVSLSSNGKAFAVGAPNGGDGVNEGTVALYVDPAPSAPTSGSNGDPHFRAWSGGHFEYHGQCDMILVKDEAFADGLGLEVQIRTKLVRFWSFIQNAAIRIGQDTLEMQGSHEPFVNKGNNHYWINSIYQGQLTSLGGFPAKATYEGKHKNKRWFFSKYGGGNKISRSFEIDLSSKYPGQKIVIGSFKEFVRVDFHNAQSNAFGNSVGMLGNFATGKLLARDGVTELKDYTKLGHEWQVLPEDGMLFHNVSYPQFPEKCIDPDARAMKRRHRRLGESSITNEHADAACAFIEDVLDRNDCIYDVLATQDISMVGAC